MNHLKIIGVEGFQFPPLNIEYGVMNVFFVSHTVRKGYFRELLPFGFSQRRRRISDAIWALAPCETWIVGLKPGERDVFFMSVS